MEIIKAYDIIDNDEPEDYYEEEKWRNLAFIGYENYDVSNYGDVRSINHGIISKRTKLGYYVARIYVNGKSKDVGIHRLVAFAFVENHNVDECNVVNHMDENKKNNYYKNLEWCTNAYNVTYGTSKKRAVATKFRNNSWNCGDLKILNSKPVYQYDFNGNLIQTFNSQTECKNIINYSVQCILNKDIPIYNDFIFSRRELSIDSIVHMVEKHKEIINKKEKQQVVYRYDFNGKEETFHDIHLLSNSFSIPAIISNLKGFTSYSQGYIWSYSKLSPDDVYDRIKLIKNYKEIYQYDFSGNMVYKYDNIDKIDFNTYSKLGVYNCMNKNILSHRNYIWSTTELGLDELIEITNRIFIGSSKVVYQYNFDGELIKIHHSVESCIRSGFVKSKLHECFRGESLQHKDFIFSKEPLGEHELKAMICEIKKDNRYKKIYQMSMDRKIIKVWDSMSSINNSEYKSSAIPECCKGKRKSYKGYIWEYENIDLK